MNNVIPAHVIMDVQAQKAADKNSPFLDVSAPKNEPKGVELFPIVDKKLEMFPICIYELREMDNKLRLYAKGKRDKLQKLYLKALQTINELEKLELKNFEEEKKNAS